MSGLFEGRSVPAIDPAAQVVASTNPSNENRQDDDQNIHVESLLSTASTYHIGRESNASSHI
jgi:hypothetical protein